MIVIFGSYRWAPKIVAFRRDWCSQCQSEQIVVGRRTIDFGHVFWIPLLPLGIWTRWFCGNCAADPAGKAETRRPFRIMAWLLVMLFVVPIAWAAVAIDPDFSKTMTILSVALAVLGGGYMTWWAFRSFRGTGYHENRAKVRPYAESICPLCEGALMTSMPEPSCAGCGAQHRPIKQAEDTLNPYG